MSVLQIPDRYTEREVIKEYKKLDLRPKRKIEEYACVEKKANTYGRTVEAYYSMPEKELIALKHVCTVKMFNSTAPCYAFCRLHDGSSYLELYLSFNEELLKKVIDVHYPGLTLKDFTFHAGSEHITYAFTFRENCILLIPNEDQSGKVVELGEPMPVDYFHYY